MRNVAVHTAPARGDISCPQPFRGNGHVRTSASQTPKAAGAAPQIDSKTFLNLLVAQLKYQDPTNPTSGTEMMAQTAQMYTVQALQDIEKQQTASAAAEGTMATSSMIGKSITATASDGSVVSGDRQRRQRRHHRPPAPDR